MTATNTSLFLRYHTHDFKTTTDQAIICNSTGSEQQAETGVSREALGKEYYKSTVVAVAIFTFKAERLILPIVPGATHPIYYHTPCCCNRK